MASDILSKQTLGDQYLNPKERELIPLLQELRLLSSFAFVVQQDAVDFHNIKDYIRKYNLTRLLPLLEKVEAGYRKQSVGALALSRLMTQLNDKKCESLWRELYGLIVASQQEYPQKTCTYDGEKLKRIRKQIEEKFHALGYTGQYPDFCKQGAIKGVKLEESYHLTYFLACEKNVKYMIHCTETLWGEDLHIEFLCGTAMLKKQETVTDIYSCCFNAKGKRLFKRVICSEEDLEQVEEFVQIAVKRAQCVKLKKYEKELCGVISASWGYYVFMFLFMGGLFALLMTATMFLICCLVTVVLFGPHELLGMIKEMPWWLLFAISFFGFGGGMTFVEMKANNK
jgi:hypothetical protein